MTLYRMGRPPRPWVRRLDPWQFLCDLVFPRAAAGAVCASWVDAVVPRSCETTKLCAIWSRCDESIVPTRQFDAKRRSLIREAPLVDIDSGFEITKRANQNPPITFALYFGRPQRKASETGKCVKRPSSSFLPHSSSSSVLYDFFLRIFEHTCYYSCTCYLSSLSFERPKHRPPNCSYGNDLRLSRTFCARPQVSR